jgi:hypothetical protein
MTKLMIFTGVESASGVHVDDDDDDDDDVRNVRA